MCPHALVVVKSFASAAAFNTTICHNNKSQCYQPLCFCSCFSSLLSTYMTLVSHKHTLPHFYTPLSIKRRFMVGFPMVMSSRQVEQRFKSGTGSQYDSPPQGHYSVSSAPPRSHSTTSL